MSTFCPFHLSHLTIIAGWRRVSWESLCALPPAEAFLYWWLSEHSSVSPSHASTLRSWSSHHSGTRMMSNQNGLQRGTWASQLRKWLGVSRLRFWSDLLQRLEPRKWFFIIYGAITIVWGGFIWIRFPDSPMTSPFLSMDDRVLAIERVRQKKTSISNSEWKWYQFWEAMRDPHTWFQLSPWFYGLFRLVVFHPLDWLSSRDLDSLPSTLPC